MSSCTCLLTGAWLLLTFGSSQEAQKPTAPDVSTQKARTSGAETAAPHVKPNDAEYKIGAQDVLRIDVWKEEQLTRTVPVRPDGKVTLPLMNDIQAEGLTPMQLAASISEGLKNIYVLRVENGKQVKHPFNYKEVVNGKNPEQNILLEPGDVIVVP